VATGMTLQDQAVHEEVQLDCRRCRLMVVHRGFTTPLRLTSEQHEAEPHTSRGRK